MSKQNEKKKFTPSNAPYICISSIRMPNDERKKSNISQAITDKSRSLTNAKSGIFGRCVYVLTEFLSNATA